jgi:hypothetical protein
MKQCHEPAMFSCTPRVNRQFLGAFVIVAMKQLGLICKYLHEIWYLRIFWKSADKCQFWLKSVKNEGN